MKCALIIDRKLLLCVFEMFFKGSRKFTAKGNVHQSTKKEKEKMGDRELDDTEIFEVRRWG
jgi:hypothetical protein